MASIEKIGDDRWKVTWRMGGRGAQKQAITFSGTGGHRRALDARRLVEDHAGRITREAVEDALFGPIEPDASPCPTLRAWLSEWMPSRTRPAPSWRATAQPMV